MSQDEHKQASLSAPTRLSQRAETAPEHSKVADSSQSSRQPVARPARIPPAEPTVQNHISLKQRWIIAACVTLTVGLFELSPIASFLETSVYHPTVYRLRSVLGSEPKLSENLKIFVYDDPTVAHFKTGSPKLDVWAKVIEALSKSSPRAILIDKLFDLPEPGAARASFVEALRTSGTDVYAAAFVSKRGIRGRPELPEDLPGYRPLGPTGESSRLRLSDDTHLAYGPHPELLDAFKSAGHVTYQGAGELQLYYQRKTESSDSVILPHLALFSSDEKVYFDARGNISIGDTRVPTLGFGSVKANLAAPDFYLKRSYSMKALIQLAELDREIPIVQPGDVVLLIPAMYTGHTDWVDSPHGLLPGGFVLTSVINSTMSGLWLNELNAWNMLALIALSAIMGVAVASYFWGTVFLIVWISTALLIPILSVALFSQAGLLMSFVPLSMAYLLTGGSIFFLRLRLARREDYRLQNELHIATIVQTTFFPELTKRHATKRDYNPEQARIGRVFGRYVPASECCGDWWHHYTLDEQVDVVVVGDALGHGLPAAFVTAVAFSAFNTAIKLLEKELLKERSPAMLLTELNRTLAEASADEMYMTMFVAFIDRDSGEVVFANAGHQPTQLIGYDSKKNKHRVKSLVCPGNPLGLDTLTRYEDKRISLSQHDSLLFLSDGLLECKDRRGREYGRRRLRKHLEAWDGSKADVLLSTLMADAEAFRQGTPQDDDITLVLYQRGLDQQRSENTPVAKQGKAQPDSKRKKNASQTSDPQAKAVS